MVDRLDYQTQMKIRRWFRKPLVTYGFISVTVIFFLMQTILGGSTNIQTLVSLGAKVNPLIIAGEWWRLFTPMFLHIGMAHIVLNGIIIYFLGIQLEQIFGHWRFFILYILSGLAGNAASFAFTESISAGASTSLFGMFASTLVLAKLYPAQPQIRAMSRNFVMLIVLNVVFGMFSMGVDNAGHIGGLVGGYLIAYALSAPNAWNNSKSKQIGFALAYVALIAVLLVIGYTRFSIF